MSSEPNLEKIEIKEEKNQETEIINNIKFPEPKDNKEENEMKSTENNLKLDKDIENGKIEPNNNIKNNTINSRKNIDTSALFLKNYESPENNALSNLNKQDSNNKEKKENINQSFMQRTKSWMSNMWTNVKSYDYGKYNIFKKTEMEDCLDAHGNIIKIPKRTNKKEIIRKKENNEDFKKYNNLNYDRYYSNSNANVYAGYPF